MISLSLLFGSLFVDSIWEATVLTIIGIYNGVFNGGSFFVCESIYMGAYHTIWD